ncbi:MAG: hypothetical protein IT454_03345 [Planctomycetes bacterium]|nr:hypothetical protein [Planctomycetota bacterium]
MTNKIVLGAVAYDAKVVTIWDGFQRWFASQGLEFDYVLYSNYERPVEQHFRGAFDVAWNSPLARIETERVARARRRTPRALAMRDTDCDLTSVIPARALIDGEVDAACMIDGNLAAFSNDGTLPRSATRVLAQTAKYDHCNFTVLDGVDERSVARFRELLLGMRYDDASVRPLMDLEGLKAWREGRTQGYAQLERACDRFGWLREFLERMQAA